MFGLPRSTEINRRIPKEKLYANLNCTPSVREMIKDQIEALIWKNKLADSTISISAGETVKELHIIEVQVRQRGLNKQVLVAISDSIPYKTLFVLTYKEEVQGWIGAFGSFYNSNWVAKDELKLRFDGLSMDAVYDGLVRQLAGESLDFADDLNIAIKIDKERKKLEREIATLEKKIQNEKQLNRQVELNAKLKRLKEELRGIRNDV